MSPHPSSYRQTPQVIRLEPREEGTPALSLSPSRAPRVAPALALCAVAMLAISCGSRKPATADSGISDRRPATARTPASVELPPALSASSTPSASQSAAQVPPPPERVWPEAGKRIPMQLLDGYAEAWPPNSPPARGGAPVSVYYHGMSASASLECPVVWGAMDHGWVVCTDGNLPYGGGGFVWGFPGSKARVEAAISALQAQQGDLVSDKRGLIIGYSLGAVPAWYHLEHSSEPWVGLVYVNATFGINPAVVKAKGIRRVAMVAGQNDASAGQMASTADTLKRQGIDAKFFRLEKTGHFFDNETWKRMMAPLRWALGEAEN